MTDTVQVFSDAVKIPKTDPDRNLVFGWASVSDRDGIPVVDGEGDVIKGGTLEDAAYEFVLKFGEANERHQGPVVGRLVESMVFTPDKLEAIGLAPDALPVAWWTGFKLSDDTFAKVKDGTYERVLHRGNRTKGGRMSWQKIVAALQGNVDDNRVGPLAHAWADSHRADALALIEAGCYDPNDAESFVQGGPVAEPTEYVVGESGPEIVAPVVKPKRPRRKKDA